MRCTQSVTTIEVSWLKFCTHLSSLPFRATYSGPHLDLFVLIKLVELFNVVVGVTTCFAFEIVNSYNDVGAASFSVDSFALPIENVKAVLCWCFYFIILPVTYVWNAQSSVVPTLTSLSCSLIFHRSSKRMELYLEQRLWVFYMFYTVQCSVIANENQQNAQMIYIFSQFVTPTCFGRAWPSSGWAVGATNWENVYHLWFSLAVRLWVIHTPQFPARLYFLHLDSFTKILSPGMWCSVLWCLGVKVSE